MTFQSGAYLLHVSVHFGLVPGFLAGENDVCGHDCPPIIDSRANGATIVNWDRQAMRLGPRVGQADLRLLGGRGQVAIGGRSPARPLVEPKRFNSSSSSSWPVHHCAVKPPSTSRLWPVTKEDRSEQSQRTASATSLGVPIRPIGCRAVNAARASAWSPKKRSYMSVSIAAGSTA